MSDLNDRIARAKGYTHEGRLNWHPVVRAWFRPDGTYQGKVPDFTGTLEGVAGMLRELNEKAYPNTWAWTYEARWPGETLSECYAMTLIEPWGHGTTDFVSPVDRPGDCVGDAYMSVFGKEETDAD